MESQPPKQGKRTALVTGGALRIGAAVCEALARSGWDLVVHVNRSRPEGEALCAALRAYGVEAWCVPADLAVAGAGETLFHDAVSCAGAVDALVNNAALFSLQRAMDEVERARLFRVNAEQPVELIRLLHQHLHARRAKGSVVNLLDQRIAKVQEESATPYELSKLRLWRATTTEALACAPLLRVNAVAPGAILLPPDKANKEPAGSFPLGVRPSPSDVAEAVRWLLEAESVTGQTLYVDGGQHLV